MIPTIHEAAERIRAGTTSPLDLLDICLANIDRYEDRVHAWVFVDREGAREEAQRLTDEVKRGRVRGPLHGIPIAVKDIFDVCNWPTAAGSKLWANSIARHDSMAVAGLRQAGAVFLGKTVTTQYASFDPPVTRNPWNLERTPGGSSSGSAAALACSMCLGALGSQTGGSITRPASYCGVAGIKPTYGRVSCAGVVPLAHSMDHPGPMARSVFDLAIMLQAIAGLDLHCSAGSPRLVPDYVVRLKGGNSPPRLGIVRGLFLDLAEKSVQDMMDQTARAFGQRGAKLVDLALPASFSEVIARHRAVMAVEAAAFHRTRLVQHPEDYAPKITALLQEGLSCPAPEYADCKTHQLQLTRHMECFLREVDALLVPATTGPAPDAGTTGDPAFNSPWSYVGFPTVSLPSAWTPDGLPLAIQLVGVPWTEAELLAVAAWCEETLRVEQREPPLDNQRNSS
jgi:aspartyl-tRNA(Asn)/glutamyl-tRNA(Gln) amidotransferase subunit A